MNRIMTCLLLFLLGLGGLSELKAQATRSDGTFYLRPQVGIAGYVGDNGTAPFTFDGAFPFYAGAELGYRLSRPFSIGVGYGLGRYPNIAPAGGDDLRHTAEVMLRHLFGGATGVAPYLQGGLHVTFGQVTPEGAAAEESRTAWGPAAGLGVDIPVARGVSLFFEAGARLAFPDDAVDGRDTGGSGSFDLLGQVGTGFSFNLGGAVAPRVLALTGPDRLRTDQEGTFTATVNEDRATRPVGYRWEWGDGTTSTGLTATHRFATPGTYTVRFTASNRAGSDTRTRTVTVSEALVPATIVTATAEPARPDTRTPVRFSATVRGTSPITHAWDFGDGTTSTETSPSHTYDQEGTYTVTLEVTNEGGRDQRSLTVTVRPYLAEVCLEVTEMNAVFFERNASVLTAEARRALGENAQILVECPNLNVRIEGFAAPGERQPQRLSADRARAVEAFYTERGIAASRMSTLGRGTPRGTTSKKDGARQYQRVDTIPVR